MADRPELEAWFIKADRIAAEAEEEIAKLRERLAENGFDENIEEAEFIFGWFEQFTKKWSEEDEQ